MKNIYLIRHCKAEGQPQHAQLTDEGLNQSVELASFLNDKGIDYILSSPFVRTIQSIEPFAEEAGLTIHIDHRLQERILSEENLPDWLEKLEASFIDLHLKLHGGESSNEATFRAIAVINDLIARKEKNIAVVSHGNLIALILKHFDHTYGFTEWKSMSNPDVFLLKLHEDKHHTERIWSQN